MGRKGQTRSRAEPSEVRRVFRSREREETPRPDATGAVPASEGSR